MKIYSVWVFDPDIGDRGSYEEIERYYISKELADAYVEEKTREAHEKVAHRKFNEAVNAWKSNCQKVREHNALVAAGLRPGPTQTYQTHPDLDSFRIDFNHVPFQERYRHYGYWTHSTEDEPQ